MGLFGSNYERAGSGIAKNAPKKKGFFRFFEIFGRKFWKLFELNLLYFLSFLPVIGAVVLALALDSQLGIILAAACLVLGTSVCKALQKTIYREGVRSR